MAPATAATATSIKKRFIFPPSGPPLHARECPDSTSPLQPCQISRQDYVWSPLMKKEANEPATAVTTKTAQHSRATSTIWPACVTGFLKEEETVTICAVEKKNASPNPWMLLPFSPLSYDHIRVAQTASTIAERQKAMITRASSRR